MRRAYPQIYDSDEKLLIDPARVSVTRRDFLAAFSAMTPASHRSAAAHARSVPLTFSDNQTFYNVASCLNLRLQTRKTELQTFQPMKADLLVSFRTLITPCTAPLMFRQSVRTLSACLQAP